MSSATNLLLLFNNVSTLGGNGTQYFDLLDDFDIAVAAGGINGTMPSPGPGGARGVTDSAGTNADITGGEYRVISSAGLHDPALRYPNTAIARTTGRILTFRVKLPTAAGKYIYPGVSSNPNAVVLNNFLAAYYFTAGDIQYRFSAQRGATGGGYYNLALVLRANGMMAFAEGGTQYPTIYLLDMGYSGNATPLYAVLGCQGNNNAGALSSVRVAKADYNWFPTPLLSDGFGAGTPFASDGLGHAEGIAGGLGVGGSGKAWTDSVGVWQNATGKANATELDTIAVRTVDLGKSDYMLDVDLTRVGDNIGLVCKWVDASNYVYAYHDGTNATLRKVVGGVDSQVIAPAAATYGAGRKMRLHVDGDYVSLMYHDSQIGTRATVNDAALQASTKAGLYTTNIGNTFDNAIAFALGTGGEYATLARFFR